MVKKSSILLNLLNLSSKKINNIISSFADSEEIFKVKRNDLERIPFLDGSDIGKILKLRKSDILDNELKLIEKEKIDCLDIFDKDYPSLLKEIGGSPVVLYIKGSRKVLNKFLFTIVGTRIPTIYGVSMAEYFACRLSSFGIVIVSGMARGIDTVVHNGAMKKGETVAVLGSGLLNIYPKENKRLAENISRKGAVISEFPLLTPPLKENFPRRNRIVSGLSKGVLVIEAAARSGALITAHLAAEQNREVFAVPGNADSPLSKGTHKLIKEGAKLVDSLEDVLEELNIKFQNSQKKPSLNLNSQEEKIFKIIGGKSGISLEEIFTQSNLELSLFNKAILDLQLKELIKEVRPSCFVKIANYC